MAEPHSSPRRGDGPDRGHQVRQGHHARDAAGRPGPRLRTVVPRTAPTCSCATASRMAARARSDRRAPIPTTGSRSASRRVERLGDLDVILMRKDPPFDIEYIYTTYILERAELQGALVVNRPQGLRDMNEKVYTAWFPECCAPTLITRDMDAMAAFAARARPHRCKPLHGMGGRSIFVVDPADKNMRVVFETLTDYGSRFAIVQRYLPEIVDHRRLARPAGGRRAGAVRAGAHALRHRQPRQPRRRRQGGGAAAQRPRPLARRARSARCCASAACCSSASTSSAASSPRSTSRARPACASSTSSSALDIGGSLMDAIARRL